jgi:hypothetical protein
MACRFEKSGSRLLILRKRCSSTTKSTQLIAVVEEEFLATDITDAHGFLREHFEFLSVLIRAIRGENVFSVKRSRYSEDQ